MKIPRLIVQIAGGNLAEMSDRLLVTHVKLEIQMDLLAC